MATRNRLTVNQASLESGTTGWQVLSNCTIATSATQAFDGTLALAVTMTGSGGCSVSTLIGVNGLRVDYGGVFTVSIYSHPGVATLRGISPGIFWYDSGGAAVGGGTSGSGTEQAGWIRFPVSDTAPATAVYGAARFDWNTSSAGEIHYIDAIQFEEGSSATTFVLPNTTGDTQASTIQRASSPMRW